MRQLTRQDIVPIEDYLKERQAFRQRIIALKKVRRLAVGPRCSLVFETFDTMRFQVQEMARIEHITDEAAILEEIACYNDLLPPGLAVGATLLIELQSGEDIAAILKQLSGIEETLRLEFGERVVPGEAEPGRSTEEKTSSVHYLTFRFQPDDARRLSEADAVRLRVDHPNYRYLVAVPPATVASLVQDLLQS